MSRRRLAVCCAVICATLIFPRQAHAGLADIIWEMSGPQMVGLMLRCRVPFGGGATSCSIAAAQQAVDGGVKKKWVWLSVEGGAYVSTGHNSGGIDYEFGRIGMFTFEPMVEFLGTGDIGAASMKGDHAGAVYFGIGPMINRFVVKGPAPSFWKHGVKLRPIAIAFSRWALEYNIRIYNDGFTPDEFGFGAPMKINRPFEAVQSISVTVPWLQWKF